MTIRSVTAVLGAGVLAVTGMVAAAPASAAAPRTLVVSPTGADTNPGTPSAPLRTIQTAVDRLRTGGTVALRGGVYRQRVRMDGVRGLTLAPYRLEHPVLSGAGLEPAAGISGLLEVRNSTKVTITRLDVTAYRSTKLGVTPVGIYVHRHDSRVSVLANHVHDLGNDADELGSFDFGAHGIAAYGDDAQASITGLTIGGNTVDNLHLGASESVVVNGNVDGWSVVGNDIHDNDNIGIDAIGFEPTLSGAYRYSERNRARNGVIAANVISRIRSRGNAAYWEDGSWCNCADGIYVDGGAHISIRGNKVTDSDIGIEVAAENPRGVADHVDVSRNLVTGSAYVGITTGGYCNGAEACGDTETGASHDNTFTYNVLRGNNRLDDGSPEVLVQYHAYQNTFAHNTVSAANSDAVVYGTVANSDSHDNTSDFNTFSTLGADRTSARFGWQQATFTGFDAYRSATGQDAHSTFR
ncbi:hypothetical protein CLV35_1136 [Motilibacter peucedani]|uniref:Parallel beta helix pectate lyase-like protein n=1 Tax=Motilibacter peucedani TaxID=598650 RepID=A0A420XRI8_9ACTN|nr:hypothetical protein [Motilibacter peucedani]RKS77450.1 hypothetical protein CLV35_1136 [Motilibacter peucedani]